MDVGPNRDIVGRSTEFEVSGCGLFLTRPNGFHTQCSVRTEISFLGHLFFMSLFALHLFVDVFG